MSEEKYKWIRLAEDFELPSFLADNQVRTVEVDGNKLAIAKIQGQYYAMNDYCPHAGGSMGKGWCSGNHQAVCPVHQIKFDVRNGRCTSGEGYRLKTYPTKMEEGSLYVGLEEKKWWGW